MSSTGLSSKSKPLNIYHDIYDFSLFPVSLGDILTWGVKSALRASAAGREKVHIHVICDLEKSGFNPLQSGTYLADLLVVEVLPAFYSHPAFAGVSVYRSREEFQSTFARVAQDDDIAQKVLEENEARYEDRANFDRTCEFFFERCTYHREINEAYKRTGTFPKVGFLKDCLVDWNALQAQFPKDTFWVTIQFRLRRLDTGMPVAVDGLDRDAPFLNWFHFISEANKQYPSVRFVLLGRLQEKPLELLRLPNVVVLRVLGMNLSHELTALLNSDLYMGSPSGFAQAAFFSDVPYDIFNCTPDGCKVYEIPSGTPRLPIASPGQRLHFGVETSEALLEGLERALQEAPRKAGLPGTLEINRSGSTDRFFISDAQSEAELSSIFSDRLVAIALTIERADYARAQEELFKLSESFPNFIPRWPEFKWLSGVLGTLLADPGAGNKMEGWEEQRHELLAEVSRYCHPSRLIRRTGRYFDNLLVCEGFRRDGWCEKRCRMIFEPSREGDFLLIRIARLSSGEPCRMKVRINQRDVTPFVLVNEPSVLEIPIRRRNIPTDVVFESDRAFTVHAREEREFSFQVEAAGLASGQSPMPGFFRGDKKDLREKIAAGIYSNGMASNLVHLRIDNPCADTEIMLRLVATLPRALRRGQHFRIRINDGEAHSAFISGKHLRAFIPCPGRPRHVGVVLQFWDRDGSEEIAKENRAQIRVIEIVPATGAGPVIASGWQGTWSHLRDEFKRKTKRL